VPRNKEMAVVVINSFMNVASRICISPSIHVDGREDVDKDAEVGRAAAGRCR